MENTTPMLRQYLEIKKEHPGTILFFRLGDFYEMFNEDAIIGSRELEITLTARQKDSPNPVPMCGVPHHSAAGYIAKLVRKGHRVAICEQAEEAGKGTKLVRREVVRVITPGTVVDPQLVEPDETVYLASVFGMGDSFGCAFLELSTGEFLTSRESGPNAWSKIRATVEGFSPREILFPESLRALVTAGFAPGILQQSFGEDVLSPAHTGSTLTGLEDGYFDHVSGRQKLLLQLGVRELTAFGLEDKPEAIAAAGACLHYAQETQKASASHINQLTLIESSDHLVLDQVTLRNLEIVESRSQQRQRSLLGVIDETVTGMGARLLKSWLVRPSVRRSEIEARLDAVSELGEPMLRDRVRFLLKEVYDLERLVGRLNLGTATARDLVALGRSLGQVPVMGESLRECESLLLKILRDGLHPLPEVTNLIERAISDEPPVNIVDGGTIRDGFNGELDDLRDVSRNAKQIIATYEDDERAKTGISSLKVRFNNVFGYYIEISKTNLAKVPEGYERKQTLANAERFTTPQLKEWEQKVLTAEDRIVQIETEIFNEVRSAVRAETQRLLTTARNIATLDVLACLAETAARRHFIRPMMHDGDEISIKDGRHPIVEAFLNEEFVPNDMFLNNSTDRLLLITGPNMGGKSTILRQLAVIQILAQIGSFVPARAASLPVIDRIWTRVGASDDLSSGRSTFMVEMTETAAILHNATPRSLVLLDEIGRGTSTFDGLSIAWAVAEFLHDSSERAAKTLFATHYHELTELAEHLPGARNYRVLASERDGDVVFLHKLEKGKASESYGIAVAKLAGMPLKVVERARQVLERLERYELAILNDESASPEGGETLKAAGAARVAAQLSLFAAGNEAALQELRNADVSGMSDAEAKVLLETLKSRIV